MSQPVAYAPATSFLAFEAQQPWFPGQELDAEFAALRATTDQVRANLGKIQRDDGPLVNNLVSFDSLTADLQEFLRAVGFLPPVTGFTLYTPVNSSSYTVKPTDSFLWVQTLPCTIIWPLSATIWRDVMVKDGVLGAQANNIHNVFTGSETCDGNADVKITSKGGLVVIGPRPGGGGYTKKG